MGCGELHIHHKTSQIDGVDFTSFTSMINLYEVGVKIYEANELGVSLLQTLIDY